MPLLTRFALVLAAIVALPLAAMAQITVPAVPQPRKPGELIGLLLQNTGAAALPARAITFGQVFLPGQVPPGRQLVGAFGSRDAPVQTDAKTAYPDGSLRMGILTLEAPPLAARGMAGVMLALAPDEVSLPPVDLARLEGAGYDLTVDLVMHGADGTTTPYRLQPGALLAKALQDGKPSYWLHGKQASELRVDAPIIGSFHVVVDIRAYEDGSTRTDIQFDNDYAMQKSGGPVTYDVAVSLNGKSVIRYTSVKQFQYQDWHQEIWSNGAPPINVVHDIDALERSGAVANYDLKSGVAAALLAQEAKIMASSDWASPFTARGITKDMPMTGARPDIGPTTLTNTLWLMTQRPEAAAFALGQADAAGTVPWHFWDAAHGTWLNTKNRPDAWTDPRGTLTQQVDQAGSFWSLDTAHQPDLSYIPYLLTGSRYYLDQLNAQAAWSVTWNWPGTRNFAWSGTGQTNDNLFFGQVRGSAWSLREVDEAAYANPTGSAAKAYFTQVMNDNWQWLVDQLPSWTTLEGQAHGYVPGVYPNGFVAPWQQDYFVSTAVQAAEMGNQNAVTYLKWATNFIAGRFLNAANGFNPRDGISYDIAAYPSSSSGNQLTVVNGAWTVLPGYQTWAEIGQATVAARTSNGTGWSWSAGDYGQLGLQSLAGIITVTGSPEAMRAYEWLRGSGAPYTDQRAFQADPTFNIVPRRPRQP